jgi:hypothetical protein
MRTLSRLARPLLAAVPTSFLAAVLPAFAAAALLALGAAPASATLLIEIDKSAQRMTVSRDGETVHTWPVSTGVRAYDTPGGEYTPFRMEVDHYSREWDDAPMPHSIFFTKKGHAIHGTNHLRSIGRPASHGCVRLEPANARVLFGLVKREGMANTKVVLTGEVPEVSAPAVARRAPAGGEQRANVEPREPRYDYPRYDYPRYEQPSQRYGEPRYIEPRNGGFWQDDRRDYSRDYGSRSRQGYWAQRPDGSMVFVDRDRGYRPPQRDFFGFPRWD